MSDMECYGIPEEYVDCEDEYDPPYECEENLDTTCCECGGKHFITPNECFPWRCINRDCKHEMCSDCKEVDCDGMTVIDSDDEDHFVIQDPDAEKEIVQTTEKGPKSLRFPVGPHVSKNLIRRFNKTCLDVQARIVAFMLTKKKRDIVLRWSHLKTEWMYEGTPVPAAIAASRNTGISSVAKEFLKLAPVLPSRSSHLPWVNYSIDTFYFDYRRCGSRLADEEEYENAMDAAADFIESQINLRPIHRVKITHCPLVGDIYSNVLDRLVSIPDLKKVTLVVHDHYRKRLSCEIQRKRIEHDQIEDQVECSSWDTSYPFKVKVLIDGVDVKKDLIAQAI